MLCKKRNRPFTVEALTLSIRTPRAAVHPPHFSSSSPPTPKLLPPCLPAISDRIPPVSALVEAVSDRQKRFPGGRGRRCRCRPLPSFPERKSGCFGRISSPVARSFRLLRVLRFSEVPAGKSMIPTGFFSLPTGSGCCG